MAESLRFLIVPERWGQKRAAFKKRYESGDKFQTTEEAFSLNMDLE
jgi:hypothetical protein